jgi:hypothetical protein
VAEQSWNFYLKLFEKHANYELLQVYSVWYIQHINQGI